MDNNTTKHQKIPANVIFSTLVKELPVRSRQLLKEELQERIPGHTVSQFNNWVSLRGKIPPYLYKEVNEACKCILQDHINSLILGIEQDDYHFNLFNIDTMKNSAKTNIFIQMAENGIRTQKELAEKTGISEQTLSRLMNRDRRPAGISWSTVKAISGFFQKSPDEFEEFCG